MVPQIQVRHFFDFFEFKYLSESFSAAAGLRDLFSVEVTFSEQKQWGCPENNPLSSI